MKKVFFISFFILGFTSIIAQLLVIREAIISFYGNELFIGLVLGFWLIWVAVGSISLAKVLINNDSLKVLIGCHFLIPFVFFAEIILLRLARFISVNPGQTPDLLLSTGYLILVTAPLCLILGLQFAVASRSLVTFEKEEPFSFKKVFNWLKIKLFFSQKFDLTYLVSQGYFYETLGLVFGGLFYLFALALFDSLILFLLLAIINFGTLIFLVSAQKVRWALIGLMTAISVIWLIPGLANYLKQTTNSWRFTNQKLIENKNSWFGNIAVTQTGNQYNFYESGLFIGSTEESFFNEEIIHLPLLYHSNPKKVLLVGGGFNGAVNEILKYPVEQVHYLELDPQLISTTQNYLAPEILASQKDYRVKTVFTDAFYFIKNTKENFDVIIINLPNPATALLNRFYTTEFFNLASSKLAKDGLLAIHLTSLENYFPAELENLAASIYRSLSKSYFSVIVLPAENILYLGSDAKLDYDPQLLIKRFDQYNLKNKLVNPDYLTYRLTNDRVSKILNTFTENKTAEINTNIRPVGYWYQNLFWLSSQYPKLANFLDFFSKITLAKLILGSFIFFFAIYYILDVLVKKRERILATITAIPEFSLLSAEVVFIFLFQVTYGYLYYQLSLIFTVILLGIAVGTWLANFLVAKNKVKYCYLFRLYFSLSLYFIFLVLLINSFPQALELPIFFYWLVFMAGFLGGMEFPMVNKYYLRDKLEPAKKTSIIYGADLVGSSFGAIATSIFLLPVLGFTKTIIFLSVINFLAFVALFFLRQNFEEG